MGKRLDQAIAEAAEIEAAEATADPDAPLPPHVTVSRPNQARSKVLQVRLNPDEFEAIERLAVRRKLPVSTVVREQLLRLLAQDPLATQDETSMALINQLLSTASRLRDVQAEACRVHASEGAAAVGRGFRPRRPS